MNITANQAAANMATLQALLLATAPSQKAADFANRLFAQVNERGAEWMAKNAAALQILSPFGDVEADRRSAAPVANNRAFYLGKFQILLVK